MSETQPRRDIFFANHQMIPAFYFHGEAKNKITDTRGGRGDLNRDARLCVRPSLPASKLSY